MDELQRKLASSVRVYNMLQDYFEKLQPLIEPSDAIPTRNAEIMYTAKAILDSLPAKTTDATALCASNISGEFAEVAMRMCKVYAASRLLFCDLDRLIVQFNQARMLPNNLVSDDLSHTVRIDLAEELGALTLYWRKFEKRWAAPDRKIIDDMSVQLLQQATHGITDGDSKLLTEALLRAVELMQLPFHTYKNSVSLYSNFMQRVLDNGKLRGAAAGEVMQHLEQAKTFFLLGNVTNELTATESATLHLTNPPLKRFGFVPATESMALDDLLALLQQRKGSKTPSTMTAMTDQRVCFIMLHHIVYGPVEYNIDRLIDIQSAKPFLQSASVGITQKTINRFHTITSLQTDEKTKWDYSATVNGDPETARDFYVLESITHGMYRVLVPWMYSAQLSLPQFRVEKLLQYVTNANEPGRIGNYQAICVRASLPNMFLTRGITVEDLDTKAHDIDMQVIRENVHLRLMSIVHAMLAKHTRYSVTNINNVIHSDRLRDAFRDELMNTYNEREQMNLMDSGRFPAHELTVTYVVALHYITRRFMKELHDGVNNRKIDPTVFTLQKDEMREQITAYLNDMVVNVLGVLLNESDNLFADIEYKNRLLNYV